MATLETLLDLWSKAEFPAEYGYAGLSLDQIESFQKAGFDYYRGKVRELLRKDSRLWVIYTDRLSVFNSHAGKVPFKGYILASITKAWFELLDRFCPTAFVAQPLPGVLEMEALEPIKAEFVLRGYMAGSMNRAYDLGQRIFSEVEVGEGLRPYAKLPKTMLTPTAKAKAYGEELEKSPAELIAEGVLSEAEWEQISTYCTMIFRHGSAIYERLGYILAETKYEFGRSQNGQIKLMDEVHTPDSSRIWVKDTYPLKIASGEAPEGLDKESIQAFLLSQGYEADKPLPAIPGERLLKLAQDYLRVSEDLQGAESKTLPGHDPAQDLWHLLHRDEPSAFQVSAPWHQPPHLQT